MKVSKITVEDVARYLRLDDADLETKNELIPLLDAAKAYISYETGLTEVQIDQYEDFYIVVMILCQDMYDNRTLYVEKSNLNKTVDTILGMHRVNLV